MPLSHWTKISKSYWPADGVRECWAEKNPDHACSPLWPHDPRFDPERIASNVQEAREALQINGGKIIAGHIPLSPDRRIVWKGPSLKSQPDRLRSCYVSAVFLPKSGILESAIRYHVRQGHVPALSELSLHQTGTWVLSNFGFFITSKLTAHHNEGGLPFSHNSRHPRQEHLPATGGHYLGGYFAKNCCPPLFPAPGVAITPSGSPHILQDLFVTGGKAWIGKSCIDWRADDVNPVKPGSVALYTPSFSVTDHSLEHLPDWQRYEHGLPEDRLHIAITNHGNGEFPEPCVAYVVRGKMRQPAGMVVLSLSQTHPAAHCPPPTAGQPVTIHCDPWSSEMAGATIQYLYQGVVDLGPGSIDWSSWTHPHSLMTQETFLPHLLRREPRAILVETANYFGCVSFSGRYEFSIGLSFQELPSIMDHLIQLGPKESITRMIGLDGGSSVKLCLVHNGRLLPLHWAAPGTRNPFGNALGNTNSTFMMRLG